MISDLVQSREDVMLNLVKLKVEMRLDLLLDWERLRQPNLPKVLVCFSEDLREVELLYQLKKESMGAAIFSSRGRRGKRLPKIQAARISINDHLITSTLSHVES